MPIGSATKSASIARSDEHPPRGPPGRALGVDAVEQLERELRGTRARRGLGRGEQSGVAAGPAGVRSGGPASSRARDADAAATARGIRGQLHVARDRLVGADGRRRRVPDREVGVARARRRPSRSASCTRRRSAAGIPL